MTREEALKLVIGDPIYIYDPGLKEVYEAKVTGITMPNVNAKTGSIRGFIPSITAWSKSLGQRVYRPDEANLTKLDALGIQSGQLQEHSDRLLEAKLKVDEQIEALL